VVDIGHRERLIARYLLCVLHEGEGLCPINVTAIDAVDVAKLAPKRYDGRSKAKEYVVRSG
jgi:hypothetical protein